MREHLIPAGETPFGFDAYLGRTLKPGQDFIGADDFMDFAAAVAAAQSGRRIILNVGDSSTAGWDTRVTVLNQERKADNKPLLSAFFRYPTYSDVLREQAGADYLVLNAGIPGHTSINTARRLQNLLGRFAAHGVSVAFVSIYCGNNDCQWEFNVEDKMKLRLSQRLPLFVDRLRARLSKPDTKRIRLRTNLRDYARNLNTMIDACRAHGAAPMIIVPEVPLYWEPGKRFVADQFPVDANMPGGSMVLAALARARELWQDVIGQDYSEAKISQLEKAMEMDFVVPRIKKAYRQALESTARDREVPLVRTRIPREQDDIDYFVDYCHPIGAANEAIAEQLLKTVDAYNEGNIRVSSAQPSVLYRLLDSRALEILLRPFGGSRRNRIDTDPTNQDIYTLY